MLTIHGVPLSVHTRKAIVTAILKDLDYRFEVVIPVIPDNPPLELEHAESDRSHSGAAGRRLHARGLHRDLPVS